MVWCRGATVDRMARRKTTYYIDGRTHRHQDDGSGNALQRELACRGRIACVCGREGGGKLRRGHV